MTRKLIQKRLEQPSNHLSCWCLDWLGGCCELSFARLLWRHSLAGCLDRLVAGFGVGVRAEVDTLSSSPTWGIQKVSFGASPSCTCNLRFLFWNPTIHLTIVFWDKSKFPGCQNESLQRRQTHLILISMSTDGCNRRMTGSTFNCSQSKSDLQPTMTAMRTPGNGRWAPVSPDEIENPDGFCKKIENGQIKCPDRNSFSKFSQVVIRTHIRYGKCTGSTFSIVSDHESVGSSPGWCQWLV